MINRKTFGQKIFAFLLAVLLAFFQMPAAYSNSHSLPTGDTETGNNQSSETQAGGSNQLSLQSSGLQNDPHADFFGSEGASLSSTGETDSVSGGGSGASAASLPSYVLPGDFDQDGDVDDADYNFWRANFGSTDATGYVIWRKFNGQTILPQLLEGYRTVVQANADALLSLVPPLEGPDGLNQKFDEAVADFNQFNIDMGNTEYVGLEWWISHYIDELENIINNPGNVSATTIHDINVYLVEMLGGTHPDTLQDVEGYMDDTTDNLGIYTNEEGFYYQRWQYASYLDKVVDGIQDEINYREDYLKVHADYRTIIDNAKTIKMLQIAPPVYSAEFGPAGGPDDPKPLAQSNYSTGWNLWLRALGEMGSGSGGSGSAARAVSYSNPSDELRMAMLSNPGDQDDQNIENNLTNFIKPQRWLDRTKAKADAKKGRSNAKTKVKDELKTKNLVVVQKYLDQGKEVLATAQETTVMLETASKSRI